MIALLHYFRYMSISLWKRIRHREVKSSDFC